MMECRNGCLYRCVCGALRKEQEMGSVFANGKEEERAGQQCEDTASKRRREMRALGTKLAVRQDPSFETTLTVFNEKTGEVVGYVDVPEVQKRLLSLPEHVRDRCGVPNRPKEDEG